MLNESFADQLLTFLREFGNCPNKNGGRSGDNDICSKERHYCHAYVGPEYGRLERILFVGLDHGKPHLQSAACLTTDRRQMQILEYRDRDKVTEANRRWNDHYRGCVIQAGRLLNLACEIQCESRCAGEHDSKCALLHFVQTNVVKSVPRENPSMRFSQHHLIEPSMSHLIEEIKVIRPKIIVLHGKPLHWVQSGAAMADDVYNLFVNKVLDAGHSCERLGPHLWKAYWKASGATLDFESYICCFFHPSMGHHRRQWTSVIVPTIDHIRQLMQSSVLETTSDS